MIPPTQLKILQALSHGPAVLSELATRTGASTTTASHSLKAMVAEGTVARSPTGYRLTGIGRAKKSGNKDTIAYCRASIAEQQKEMESD